MNTMLRWSPTRQFHLHHDDNLFARFFGDATDEAAQRPPWLPAAEGRTEDGTYVIQLALPGVDPKDVNVSLMDNVLTVKGERKAEPDTMDKDYFVREAAYDLVLGHRALLSLSPALDNPEGTGLDSGPW